MKDESLHKLWEIRLPVFANTKDSIGDIVYLLERKLAHNLITGLGTCDFIARKRNVLVIGATETSKHFWPPFTSGCQTLALNKPT